MEIKKLTVIVALLTVLVLTPGVLAQNTDLPSPGLTPDSPLYFLDTWGENIGLALTRGPEAKVRKQIAISQEKLAEAEQMGKEGKAKAAEIAADRYGEMVNAAAAGVAFAAQSEEGFAGALGELLVTTISISQNVLAGIYEKVPEQAKAAIQRAMQVSIQGMERAMEAVSNTKREQVQEQVEQNLQKARESAPAEVQQYIPATIPGGAGGKQPGGTTPSGAGKPETPRRPEETQEREVKKPEIPEVESETHGGAGKPETPGRP